MMSSSNEAMLDISASSDRSSKHEQEQKEETASCQDEPENNAEDDEDFTTSLSVGDGHYLVDLGSSSEFVVDEWSLLELFRRCRQCGRNCMVIKRVCGLKVVVDQRCSYCKNRLEWTNLPDNLCDEDDKDFNGRIPAS